MTSRTKMKRKQVDDVLGGEEMWKHADSTAGTYTHPAAPPALRCAVSDPRGLLLATTRSDVPQVRPWQGLLLSAPNQVR